jgi:N-acetylglutamate synthase-like GNAT family acetyltransferase
MYTFRHATPADSRAIRKLIYHVGINPMSLNWRRFLVVIDENKCLIGCGQIKPHGDGTRELASIAVVPERQGQGIGTQIITRLLQEEPLPLYLTCRSTTGPYYYRFGFQKLSPADLPPYFQRILSLANIVSSLFPNAGRMWVMAKIT